MDKPKNFRTVTVKMTRRELVDLLIACSAVADSKGADAAPNKWHKLHDKLREQLALFDLKN